MLKELFEDYDKEICKTFDFRPYATKNATLYWDGIWVSFQEMILMFDKVGGWIQDFELIHSIS